MFSNTRSRLTRKKKNSSVMGGDKEEEKEGEEQRIEKSMIPLL